MSMEHYRPAIDHKKAGYYQGYYCGRCGAPGVSIYSTKHGNGICLANPKMVKILVEANSEDEENKREFTRKLKGQPSWTR